MLSSSIRERLSEKQRRAIELLANGENKQTVAKMVEVNPKTIYAWLKIDIFKDELDRQVMALKKDVETKLATQVAPLMDNLIKIALTSKDERVRLQATTYALDRLYGKATTKQEVKVETKDTTQQIENIDDIFSDLGIDVVDVEPTDVKPVEEEQQTVVAQDKERNKALPTIKAKAKKDKPRQTRQRGIKKRQG